MAQVLADRRDIEFVLYEQLDTEALVRHDPFREFSRKLFDMIITEARTLALKELLPTSAEGDRAGVVFEKGAVKVPECYHRPFRLLTGGEWTSMTEDPDWGGQGVPQVINRAAMEYLWGANYCLANYGFMGHGTGKMIEIFGTGEQKNLFLRNLYTGKWGGTMLLTEPEAGSDVGALNTTAKKNPDGTYAITGNKIFITNGEHDLSENIIHPVLARIEGAPLGTRGISIFIVPKIRVNADGTLGEPNDVVCTGVEEKLGIHSSATCSMALGGQGNCHGLLLGKENKGMAIMFHMMNEARLNVGFQAFTCASAAYLYAANYAKERVQGKDLADRKNAAAESVTIIHHPDVRRMLMWMKAHVDGMRSFIYYVYSLMDRAAIGPDEEDAGACRDLVDLFTPLVKAYCSQRSFEVCVQAMQVYGGYGYTREYPIEQLLRDCKITSIYEGTDGIQAMDLLGRKLGMNQGRTFLEFIGQVKRQIEEARRHEALMEMAAFLDKTLEPYQAAAMAIGQKAASEAIKTGFLYAFPFLEATGELIMAWMLLWRANVASRRLAGGKTGTDRDYYQGIIHTAAFFIHSVLPGALGKMDAIVKGNSAALEIPETCFGG